MGGATRELILTSRPLPRPVHVPVAPLLDPCKQRPLQTTTTDSRTNTETCFAEHCRLSIYRLSVFTNVTISKGIPPSIVITNQRINISLQKKKKNIPQKKKKKKKKKS